MSDILEKVTVIDAVIKYLYNVNKEDIFFAVYGESYKQKAYIQEKIELMSDVSRFWGQLDNQHKQRLVKCASDYYECRC